MNLRTSPISVLLTLLALSTLALLCAPLAGCDGGDDDDSTDDDDDTSDDDDDDDSAADDDDDTASGPCDYTDAWYSALPEPDPTGDSTGVIDLIDWQYQLDEAGDTLYLRNVASAPFDDNEGTLVFVTFIGTSVNTQYALVWDNQNAGGLMVFTYADGYAAPMDPTPASYHYCFDTDDAFVMGIDLADLEATGATSLTGFAGVYDWYAGYLEVAPDDGDGTVYLVFTTEIDLDGSSWTDAGGDMTIDPGESVDLTISVVSTGNDYTGAGVTGTLSLAASSTAAATVDTSSATFNGGAAIDPGATATTDTPFTFTVDAGAEIGQTLEFELAVSDDDGNSWSFTLPPLFVGAEMVLTDGDDFDAGFDNAGLAYWVDGTAVHVLVTSHDNHAADQEVVVLMDTDRDGNDDYALSTIDADSGFFSGGVYRWVEPSWIQIGTPDEFMFTSGSDFAFWTVPLAMLGDPAFAITGVRTSDPVGPGTDDMPDDLDDADDRAVLILGEEPYLVLDGQAMTQVVGNGDNFPDPGETWNIDVTVANIGTADTTNASGTLSSSDADVTVTQSSINFGTVVAGGTTTSSSPGTITIDAAAPADGTYELALAVTASGHQFDLRIVVVLGAQAVDTTDDSPAVINSDWVLTGDTTDFTDDYSDPSACTGWLALGNDVVFALDLDAGDELDIDLDFDAFPPDAVIYVSDTPTDPDINCVDGADDHTNSASESLRFEADTAGIYYLIVDSYSAGGGPFTLDVNFR